MITDSQIQEFSDKGAILLKKAFNIEWLSLLAEGIEKNRKNPGPHACQYTPDDKDGDFYDDYCNWQRFDEYRDFIFKSPAAEIAGRITKSDQIRIFHEHILVKEPKTTERTPWHHDQPFTVLMGIRFVASGCRWILYPKK